MNYYPYAAMLAAAILVALATFKLHSSVKSLSSFWLCVFAPLAVIYHPFSLWLFGQALNNWPSWMSNWLLWIAVDLLPATLVLVASGLFYIVIGRQDRPNQSFKPNPLRGSA